MAEIEGKIILPDPDYKNKFEVNLVDVLSRYTMKLGDIINGGLRVADNWDAQIITVTIPVAGVEQIVPHTLKRVPVGYIVVSTDINSQIYNGTTAWTTTNIYITSNVNATTVKIILI